MTLWWGEPWPRPDFRAAVCEDDANRIDVPAGEPCARCQTPIVDGDRGVTIPHLGGDHDRSHFTIACFLRDMLPEPLVSKWLARWQLDDQGKG